MMAATVFAGVEADAQDGFISTLSQDVRVCFAEKASILSWSCIIGIGACVSGSGGVRICTGTLTSFPGLSTNNDCVTCGGRFIHFLVL